MSWCHCQERSNRQKKQLTRLTVARYLNACKNIQLKTALHVMASNGPRPIELCAVRECDVNLDSDPATITYTAEYSKMRVARTRPLTREAANQLRLWDKFKYRTRWTTVKDEENGESVRKFAAPKRNPYNLLLSMPHLNDEKATPDGLYDFLSGAFAELIDILDGNRVVMMMAVIKQKGRRAPQGNTKDIPGLCKIYNI